MNTRGGLTMNTRTSVEGKRGCGWRKGAKVRAAYEVCLGAASVRCRCHFFKPAGETAKARRPPYIEFNITMTWDFPRFAADPISLF
jgi:hypothetical protein